MLKTLKINEENTEVCVCVCGRWGWEWVRNRDWGVNVGGPDLLKEVRFPGRVNPGESLEVGGRNREQRGCSAAVWAQLPC